MCSNYTVSANARNLAAQYDIPIEQDALVEKRIFPHKPGIVVTESDGKRHFQKMNYSLIPSDSDTARPKFATYNARIETIAQLKTWKLPFKSTRCLVPMSGFYESVREGPYAGNVIKFSDKRGQVLTAGGIWTTWIDPISNQAVNSYAIVTKHPTQFISENGHDRSPLFLPESYWSDWLQVKETNPLKIVKDLSDVNEQLEFAIEIDRPLKS